MAELAELGQRVGQLDELAELLIEGVTDAFAGLRSVSNQLSLG